MSSFVNNGACPSELGIVFKNRLKLQAQHDVPFGLQSATEECLEGRGKEYQTLPCYILFVFLKDHCFKKKDHC